MSAFLRASFFTSALLVALVPVACGGDGSPTTSDAVSSSNASSGGGSGGGGGASSSSGSGTGASGSSTSSSSASSSASSSSGSSGGLVRFAALGDVGKGNQGQKDVALAIADKCAQDGCDFVQLLGDNIYDSGVDSTSDPQWQDKFEIPYAPVDLPFWVVLGNHDYGGNGTGNEFGKGQNEIDYTAVSTKWKLPSAYYTRSQAHVDFFALDTNMAMFHQAAQQQTDMKAALGASSAKWKIAFGHHPYLSNGPHGNAGEYEGLPFVPIVNGAGVKDLLEATVCGSTDFYISGHDHSLQLLQGKCGGTTQLIVSGAGASTSELGGSNPTYFETLELSFVYVRIQDGTLTAEVIDVSGNVLATRTVTK